MTTPLPEALHITHPSRLSLLGYALIALAFTALCGWMLYSSDSTFHLIVGALGVVFSGCGIVVFLSRLGQAGKDMYVLDEEGVHFGDTRYAMIPWQNVEGLAPFSIHGQHFVGLVLSDEVTRVAALPRALRLVVQGNQALGLPAFSLLTRDKKTQKQCMERCMYWLEQEALREA